MIVRVVAEAVEEGLAADTEGVAEARVGEVAIVAEARVVEGVAADGAFFACVCAVTVEEMVFAQSVSTTMVTKDRSNPSQGSQKSKI